MSDANDSVVDGLYPMRAVTRLTGLTPDTIRVWERRYGAVTPRRTPGGARRYGGDDVRRLQRLVEATRRGHSIGDIARLSLPDLDRLMAGEAAPVAAPADACDRLVADYLDAVGRFDTRRAGEVLASAAALLSPWDLAQRIVMPVLRALGDRWAAGTLSVAHEHLASAQVHGLLMSLLRVSTPAAPGAPRLVAATPAGHRHEFGALIGAISAASMGWAPVYLGPDVPLQDLLRAVEGHRRTVVLLSVLRDTSAAETAALKAYVADLAKRAVPWVGMPPGHAAARVLAGLPETRLFHSFDDLAAALRDPRAS